MRRFAALLDRLTYTPSRNGKIRLIERYLSETPDPDRGWALCVLAEGIGFRFSYRKLIGGLLAERIDPVLFDLSRDYVGDTAETVALLWPSSAEDGPTPALTQIVERLLAADLVSAQEQIEGWLDELDATGRWALLKLVSGALRVGVSARLAKTALARFGGVEVSEIEEVWHGSSPPYEEIFRWLEGKADKPDLSERAIFRPPMLAHPLEEGGLEQIDLKEFATEWKWDGIRVQISAVGGEVRLYSRAGDDIGKSFPELLGAGWQDVVLDGELLVLREGEVAPFNDLQQRLNRKSVTKRQLEDYPAHVRLYDILFRDGRDLRAASFSDRRAELEDWYDLQAPSRSDLSEMLSFASSQELEAAWGKTRANGIEGLMLKRLDSPYLAGRPKGHWFKWKRAPLTLDTVLMYAQRGSGKRSSYYSDYTFGAWRKGEGGQELVPVGKAYFGFSDEELRLLDRWVRMNTVETYGPVRAVNPLLVLEVAFDAVHESNRHKSGVAMRFPRIHRIRWDKPADEADKLQTLVEMIER